MPGYDGQQKLVVRKVNHPGKFLGILTSWQNRFRRFSLRFSDKEPKSPTNRQLLNATIGHVLSCTNIQFERSLIAVKERYEIHTHIYVYKP